MLWDWWILVEILGSRELKLGIELKCFINYKIIVLINRKFVSNFGILDIIMGEIREEFFW